MTSTSVKDRRVLIAITGASGTRYAERLVEILLGIGVGRIYIVTTDAGQAVARHELARSTGVFSLLDALAGEGNRDHLEIIRVFRNDDLFAPIASGSSAPTDMVIVPCSMGSLSRVASAVSSNLLERAADVMLKQRRRLVVVPRETPLHAVHLEHMLTLSRLGAIIVPPSPGFYHRPKSIDDMIDFVVGRVLEIMDLPHELYTPWNRRMM